MWHSRHRWTRGSRLPHGLPALLLVLACSSVWAPRTCVLAKPTHTKLKVSLGVGTKLVFRSFTGSSDSLEPIPIPDEPNNGGDSDGAGDPAPSPLNTPSPASSGSPPSPQPSAYPTPPSSPSTSTTPGPSPRAPPSPRPPPRPRAPPRPLSPSPPRQSPSLTPSYPANPLDPASPLPSPSPAAKPTSPTPPPSPSSRPANPPTPRSPPAPPPVPKGKAVPPAPPTQPEWPPLSPFPPPQPPYAPEPPSANVGRYEVIATSNVIAVHLVHVPGTDSYLFMERPSGYHPDRSNTIAGFMDYKTTEWTHIFSPDGLFCCGHTILDSGDVVVVGGHQANAGYPDGMSSLRSFNRSLTDLQLVKHNEMYWRRWYPTATLLPDGRVLIMGGTQGVGAGTANNPNWEMLDPKTWTTQQFAMRPRFLDDAKQVYYPFNYVLPQGNMFVFAGRFGWILDWEQNRWFQDIPKLRGYATTQFPFTGTSCMLGLYPENGYKAEIMLFGGQKEAATKDLSIKANKNANRLTLEYDPSSGNYTIVGGGWQQEVMGGPRLMGDVVLLPNGKVVLLNGAEEGLAGDSAKGGESRANYPVLHAEIYDPDGVRDQRFTRVASTRIARMYHSTTALTPDGTVLVAGCDRCYRYAVTPGVRYDPSPVKADYRVEIYYPPYYYRTTEQPAITSLSSEVMDYGEPFQLSYNFPNAPAGAGFNITRVVLVAPSSCTHSFNTNQRLVGLEVLEDNRAQGTMVVRGPPSVYVAVPQIYMVFLLNGDVYSKAAWVTLRRPESGPALLPLPR